MAREPMFALTPDCGYFMVSDAKTHEAIAVVEAGDEVEAGQFFGALRHILQASSQVHLCVLESVTLPNEIPVFRRQYLKAMQVNAT